MPTPPAELLPVRSAADIVAVRQAVREAALRLGFGLVDQTKIVTAASELARNTLDYGGGGTACVEVVEDGRRVGLRLTFADSGPGIPDVPRAMQNGFTTGKGLGLGLGGTKRLTHELTIETAVGVGTRVVATRWK